MIYKSNIDGEFNKFESSLFEFRNKTANETNEIKEGCETITVNNLFGHMYINLK